MADRQQAADNRDLKSMLESAIPRKFSRIHTAHGHLFKSEELGISAFVAQHEVVLATELSIGEGSPLVQCSPISTQGLLILGALAVALQPQRIEAQYRTEAGVIRGLMISSRACLSNTSDHELRNRLERLVSVISKLRVALALPRGQITHAITSWLAPRCGAPNGA